jgi:hypothetical protein
MQPIPHPSYAEIEHYRRIGHIVTVVGAIFMLPGVGSLGMFFWALLIEKVGIASIAILISAVLFVAYALLLIFTGRQSLKGKAWTRPVLIILGFLFLLGFPLGTALGVYSLVKLLPEKSRGYYKN